MYVCMCSENKNFFGEEKGNIGFLLLCPPLPRIGALLGAIVRVGID